MNSSPKDKPPIDQPLSTQNAVFDAPRGKADLNSRMRKGGAITISAQAAKFLIRMGSTAVLARLLTPADFGLIGMVTVMTGFIEMFKEAGLSTATVQSKTITHAQISALYWINIALSVALMLLKFGLAPAIAWVYDEPRLTAITIVLASFTIFGGISVQHEAVLRRRMQFGVLALIDIVSSLIGIITAVYLASSGYGYWSLVGMPTGTAVSGALLLSLFSGWKPSLPNRTPGIGRMLRFGGNLAGAGFFNYLTRNADNFIVGLVHGPAGLGIYSRGYSLFLMPLQQFLSPVSAVVIPALSRVTDDVPRFREILLEKSYMVTFCVVVSTGASFAAAPELVRIVLGSGWDQSVDVLRALAIGGAIYGTNIAGGWISTTHGWSYRQLRLAMVAGPIYATAFWLGSFHGVVGVAAAFSLTCVALRYPAFTYLCKDSPIKPMELISPLLKVGAISAVGSALAILSASRLTNTVSGSLALKIAVYSSTIALAVFSRVIQLPKVSR